MLTVNATTFHADDIHALMRDYNHRDYFQHIEGNRFALCLPDPLDTITLVLFLRERGGSVVLLHAETPEATAKELAVQAQCCGLLFGSPLQFIPLAADRSAHHAPSLCQFSSGTTGAPKLISRSWEDIQREINHYNEALLTEQGLTPVILSSVSHSYGLISGVLSALERGCAPTIVTNKNPKFALNIIAQTPRHIVYGVPLLFHVMAGFLHGQIRFHKLISSGAPLPEALFNKLNPLADAMLQQYGCSETGCISISNRIEASTDLGYPLKHLTLQASFNASQPAEIVANIGGRTVHTQDLGYFADNGSLRFAARADDVINVSGLKVFPLEVEEKINRLNGVKESVVYRGQHPVMGEIVKAQAVTDGSLTPANIRDWCLHALPPYKVPFEIQCVARIPKNANGKVSRKLLEIGGDEAR